MVSPFDLMFWAGIIVLILILGPSKIPSLARAIGEAVREWRRGLEGLPPSGAESKTARAVEKQAVEAESGEESREVKPQVKSSEEVSEDHPIVRAAIKEGIDVRGKSLDEIADELASKLKEKKKKQSTQSSTTQSI